jgi:hypothetical protein
MIFNTKAGKKTFTSCATYRLVTHVRIGYNDMGFFACEIAKALVIDLTKGPGLALEQNHL